MKEGYKATIGLEIHAELKTKTKMFCACKNDPDEEKANANVCPVCMGYPGTLPVLNKEAIKHVLKIGTAINADIADFTEWDRKNYFYPDIPKGYQISQYAYPLIKGGEIAGIKITRIHLEEDTAKSTHDIHETKSLVDFNRAGVPLMELVTEPVIHSGEDASKFAKELQLLLRYLNIGEANMEKGEMRVEANVSVSKTDKLGTKTEIKNLNSFKVVEKSIAYEIKRQIEVLESGKEVVQETRGWNEIKQQTFSQRAKENSHDYRYFPDPDIPKLYISEVKEFSKNEIEKDIKETPESRRKILVEIGANEVEREVFISQKEVGDYLFEVIKNLDKKYHKLAINYIVSDYLGILNKNIGKTDKKIDTISIDNFKKIMTLVGDKKITSRGAKDLIKIIFEEGGNVDEIVVSRNIIQEENTSDLESLCKQIIMANNKAVMEYNAGKLASLQYLIGQVMKESKGRANPESAKTMLENLIKTSRDQA